jgi:predicted DNA-binding transcriptional regulator AlpA
VPPQAQLSVILEAPERLREVEPEAIPRLLAELETLRARLWIQMLTAQSGALSEPQREDRLLTVQEVAARLGVEPKWLYRRHRSLPFTRRLTRKTLRFSESGFQEWLGRRQRQP